MSRTRLVILWVCLTAVLAVPAHATFLEQSTLADWQSKAQQSGSTIDFSTPAVASGSYANYASLTLSGVTFSSYPTDFMSVVNPSAGQTWYQWDGEGPVLRGADNLSVKAALAVAVTAFATDFMIYKYDGANAVGSQMTVTVGKGAQTLRTNTVTTQPKPSPTFYGVVSDDPSVTFDWILFTPATNYAVLDNFRVGSYQASVPVDSAPEPGTALMALSGAGLLGLGLFRRKALR